MVVMKGLANRLKLASEILTPCSGRIKASMLTGINISAAQYIAKFSVTGLYSLLLIALMFYRSSGDI